MISDMPEQVKPNLSQKRVLIASYFLPVSSKKHTQPMTTTFPSLLKKRTSLISSLQYLSQPKMASDSTPKDLLEETFVPSNTGNPGLYNAVNSIENEIGSILWVGSIGSPTDQLNDAQKLALSDKLIQNHRSKPIYLTADEVDGHYNTFCKQVLWQPFHYQLSDHLECAPTEDKAWKMYIKVNQKFSDCIVETYQEGDVGTELKVTLVWINDYHLMLVPEMVRKALPKATIGFFLHVPFPSSEIFRCLPVRKELLKGLLSADLVGFQIYAFMRHFLMTCSRLLALESSPQGIQMQNSMVTVGSYPIGINMHTLNEKRSHPEVLKLVAALKEKYAGKYVVIGRDKNDYVKGVHHKLLSFERFLEKYPEMHGKAVLIQVSLSTTEANENQSNVSTLVGRINSKFGTFDYVPIVYLHQDISFQHYLALLTMADACLITSLRDGMNLTSHEYVVCQENNHSPLIISEFAGTYSNFGAALRVNPWDTAEVANAIYEALTMSAEDKAYRWNVLYNYVSTNNAQQFVGSFLEDLILRHEDNLKSLSTSIPHLPLEYLRCVSIFLDDDGTLLNGEFAERPLDTSETYRVHDILTRLLQDSRNVVYLMSGRSRAELAPFLKISGLGITAENGCFIRFPKRNGWENMIGGADLNWRKSVLEVFEFYTDRTPGSYVEEKEIGIAWHYGHTDLKYGQWQAAECSNHINNSLHQYPIHIMARKNCIEIYLCNVSKGTAIRRILQYHQSQQPSTNFAEESVSSSAVSAVVSVASSSKYSDTSFTPNRDICDFIFCVGNDRADEYMFEYLHKLSGKNSAIFTDLSPTTNFDDSESFSIASLSESPVTESNISTSLLPPELRTITCTVGSKSSTAKWYVSSVNDVLEGLDNILLSM